MQWDNTPPWKWETSPDELLELLRDLHPVTTREKGLRALLAILVMVSGEKPTLEGVDRWFEALHKKYPDSLADEELTVDDFVSQALYTRDDMRVAEESTAAGEERSRLRKRHAEVLWKRLRESRKSVEEVSRELGYEKEQVLAVLEDGADLTYQMIFKVLDVVGADVPGYFAEVTQAEDSEEPN